MNELYGEVESLRKNELERASAKFGQRHRSPHEAYGVIQEEADEVVQAANEALGYLMEFWDGVKLNDEKLQRESLEGLRLHAQLAACEMIQVAAMADKALRGYGIPVREIPKGTTVRAFGSTCRMGEDIRPMPCGVFISVRRKG